MNQIPYEERKKTYMNALITYGDRVQIGRLDHDN